MKQTNRRHLKINFRNSVHQSTNCEVTYFYIYILYTSMWPYGAKFMQRLRVALSNVFHGVKKVFTNIWNLMPIICLSKCMCVYVCVCVCVCVWHGYDVHGIILFRDLKRAKRLDRNINTSVHVSTCTRYDFNALTSIMWKLWRW